MSEPLVPAPSAPPPRPFAPEKVVAREGGCGKPLWIGCGVLLLLVALGAVAFLLKAKDLAVYAMGELKNEIVANLPPDVTAEEKARLESAFAQAGDAVRAGKADPAALQGFQVHLLAASRKIGDKTLKREDVLDLTRELEAIAGAPAPAPGAAAKPAAGPPPH